MDETSNIIRRFLMYTTVLDMYDGFCGYVTVEHVKNRHMAMTVLKVYNFFALTVMYAWCATRLKYFLWGRFCDILSYNNFEFLFK